MIYLGSILVVILAGFSYYVYDDGPVEIEIIADPSFQTFTSAVCEENNGFVECKDELFVNCNGNISNNIKECNGFSVMDKVSGFAVFEKDWKDPREN
tara:strand:+ start:47958 stop:48248 length:291 start_codon:yes stop_codon:yes gene_type:complete